MELVQNLALGFAGAATPVNLLYGLVGCLLGTLIGILPGLGPLATISMLLPFTYGLDPLSALIMLAGIFYGAQYGGSTTAILVNLPGETSSVVTMIDGNKMARQGRAGAALSVAALGSFFGGCVGTLTLAAFAVPLARFGLSFGPAEYFSLMILGLVGAVLLVSGPLAPSFAMIAFGILLGLVGTDVNSGALRYTFGLPDLWEGIDFVVLAVGIFATSEIVDNLDNPEKRPNRAARITTLWPSRQDLRRASPAVLRGTLLGSLIGILPGAGASIASFLAYSVERRVSKYPAEFGQGAIEGVAGPESANNAAAQTSFIPTLTLGIPGSATMALMLGAMTIHNITPGPQVIRTNPDLFWGLIASMWIGNVFLVLLNLPLVRVWVRLVNIPYTALYPAILVFCCVGVYTAHNAPFDLYLAAGFGVLGYVFRKLDLQPAPFLLGFVLGPMLEEHFRRSLVLSHGSYSIFFQSAMSLFLLLVAAVLIGTACFSSWQKRRRTH